jgi:hypothetical protein
MNCKECNNTRVYRGLDLAPPEPCQTCCPHGFLSLGDQRLPLGPPVSGGFVSVPMVGSRNERVYKLAEYFASKGVERDLARPQIHQWRDQHAAGLPDAEVDQCIDSAYGAEAQRQWSAALRSNQSTVKIDSADLAAHPLWVKEDAKLTAVKASNTPPDHIAMTDTKGRKFTASIDEWCSAMQAQVDGNTFAARNGDFDRAEFEGYEPGKRWARVQLRWTNTVPVTNAVVQAKSADEIQDEFCRQLEAELRKHLPDARKAR